MPRYLRTSDLARAVGIHPNTVRLYEKWGLIPPVERSPTGYRQFTQIHLDCLRLARTIYAADYPGRALRGSANAIIHEAVADNWGGALEKAEDHLSQVRAELTHADAAATELEKWAQNRKAPPTGKPLSIGNVSKLLGVSQDVIRNWERNGLIIVPRNSYNGYRLFRSGEISRLRVIRMLSRAGYSHMAMLRMFLDLDGGRTDDLRRSLDTPRPDEDIFFAADHWLSTLHAQEQLARQIIQFIQEQVARRKSASIS